MALCMAVLVQAQTDEISMSVSTPVEDNGDWVVQVSMDNPGQSITTLQFDLSIPEDFSYTAGNYLLTSRATIIRGGREVDTHSVVSGRPLMAVRCVSSSTVLTMYSSRGRAEQSYPSTSVVAEQLMPHHATLPTS